MRNSPLFRRTEASLHVPHSIIARAAACACVRVGDSHFGVLPAVEEGHAGLQAYLSKEGFLP